MTFQRTTSAPAADRARWLRRAEALVLGTLLYNVAEAVVALWAGERAGSIALVGFGLDSLIEIMAGTVVLWRMLVEHSVAGEHRIDTVERRARRLVGVTFWLLAIYVVAQSGLALWRRQAPAESLVGIVIALLSLVLMPLLAWGKIRAARALDSGALAAEAQETLACAYLSLCLLAGLGLNALFGWWWADPLGALAMVPWLLREGREAWEG
ncbi:MAG TPA: cation transporter [Gemmatimonadales bacterium]|nr:cation transporter [Gemmatimonadales bacterium]